MLLSGPRPALWNQDCLTALRDEYGANEAKPGLTGWAQINGRDELELPEKARLDGEYVKNIGLAMDAKVFIEAANTIDRNRIHLAIRNMKYAVMLQFIRSYADREHYDQIREARRQSAEKRWNGREEQPEEADKAREEQPEECICMQTDASDANNNTNTNTKQHRMQFKNIHTEIYEFGTCRAHGQHRFPV